MNIRLWGVRGSIPCPGPQTAVFGGNTACMELSWGPEDSHVLVVDAGSGIRPLGNQWMRTRFPQGPIKTRLLFSHTHWDHIMGFPFFTPIFIPSTEIEIYGPVTFEEDSLDKVIGGQLQYRYFPVTMAELAAKITYYRLQETQLEFELGLKVTTKYLNHPITCLGYRFEHEDKVIVTLFDHEPFRNLFITDPQNPDFDQEVFEEGERAAAEENQKILEFMHNADVVVHDAQYTEKEYRKNRTGWGHSSIEWAINAAHKAGVKTLVLMHHDPERLDSELEKFQKNYERLIQQKSKMKLVFAQEGMVF
ncbi:MAG: MBL fold metallo-hydrolase [Spirochaetales bacterium]|nr:MBL fold metallo-hydrolase [Spirochaetales bacterium]